MFASHRDGMCRNVTCGIEVLQVGDPGLDLTLGRGDAMPIEQHSARQAPPRTVGHRPIEHDTNRRVGCDVNAKPPA